MSAEFWIGFYFGALTVSIVYCWVAIKYLTHRIDDELAECSRRAALASAKPSPSLARAVNARRERQEVTR